MCISLKIPLAKSLWVSGLMRLFMKINKNHIGSSFDEFLEQENVLAEVNAVAIKRVLAYKLQEAMDKKGLTKSEMAKRMHTSRAALDRFLDPENISITLATMEKAAIAMGKKLEIKLVRA